jgi:hypothetical protein
MIAMVRVVLHVRLKWVYAISYLLLLVLRIFSNPEFLAIAFDSGRYNTQGTWYCLKLIALSLRFGRY